MESKLRERREDCISQAMPIDAMGRVVSNGKYSPFGVELSSVWRSPSPYSRTVARQILADILQILNWRGATHGAQRDDTFLVAVRLSKMREGLLRLRRRRRPNLLRKIRIGSEAGNCFSVQCPSHYWQREREGERGSRLTRRSRESLMVAGRPINQFWLRETIKRMIHLQKLGRRQA